MLVINMTGPVQVHPLPGGTGTGSPESSSSRTDLQTVVSMGEPPAVGILLTAHCYPTGPAPPPDSTHSSLPLPPATTAFRVRFAPTTFPNITFDRFLAFLSV